jgi:transcriptional regulator GlxA family with amidase domain
MSKVIQVILVALPETSGAALYGMLEVLKSVGVLWQELVHTEKRCCFSVSIVSIRHDMFWCGYNIPVQPDCNLEQAPDADVIIVPELWLGPDEVITGRYPTLVQWLKHRYQHGASLFSACSGAIVLAETGLLNGRKATSHWGYQDLFRKHYPEIKFQPQPNLVIADAQSRLVTAGGTTSWHDLALYVIGLYAGAAEAIRIAKVYLLKWHSEGQLPYQTLNRHPLHADAVVKKCQKVLEEFFIEPDALLRATQAAGIPERTLKRRFKQATGCSLIDYIQNLRIEKAKQLLESTELDTETVSETCGYADVSFFRRLFKRLCGVTPAHYRKLFKA